MNHIKKYRYVNHFIIIILNSIEPLYVFVCERESNRKCVSVCVSARERERGEYVCDRERQPDRNSEGNEE